MKKSDLNQFRGSDTFTQWTVLSKSVLTEGALFVAVEAGAFWLFDTIQSHISSLDESMVVSKLTVQEDKTATLDLDDGNGNMIASQLIPYTDFPLEEITIWSIQTGQGNRFTHMLVSEY